MKKIILPLFAIFPSLLFGGPKIDDFNLKFSVPAPSGDVTTYIYEINGDLMVEEVFNKICISENQVKYSILRFPIDTIDRVYHRELAGQFAIVLEGGGSGGNKKYSITINCY